ncbi:thioredoxin fold domain-containing protein, partial [Gilvimarinus sp. SDUM040013]|uniref:thioredoxin family protein n=1 Tax=Gilvimarinus gilvus TaxID=3058038 RepID=UPI00267342DC
ITQVFTHPDVNTRMRQRYDLVSLDLWGDRTITLPDDTELTEKALAVKLKVQYTPTLIFLDSDGSPQLRIDGYRPVDTFIRQLDRLQTATKSVPFQAETAISSEVLGIPLGKPVAIR